MALRAELATVALHYCCTYILYIFLTHSSSGNFAETRDGLDSRGADRHRVSPNHPKFHQNSPRAVDEWGNELFLMFEKLGVKKYEK